MPQFRNRLLHNFTCQGIDELSARIKTQFTLLCHCLGEHCEDRVANLGSRWYWCSGNLNLKKHVVNWER